MDKADVVAVVFFAVTIPGFATALFLALWRGSVVWWLTSSRLLFAKRRTEPVRYWFGVSWITICLVLLAIGAVRTYLGIPVQ